jgi:hypothetical protein
MPYRLALIGLCLLVLGAVPKLCPLHNVAMTREQVPIIFRVDRFNVKEWEDYTNARARFFPNSCDEMETNADELFNSEWFQKHGWKDVPTNAWIDVCPICEKQKQAWLAAHPPRQQTPGEFP